MEHEHGARVYDPQRVETSRRLTSLRTYHVPRPPKSLQVINLRLAPDGPRVYDPQHVADSPTRHSIHQHNSAPPLASLSSFSALRSLRVRPPHPAGL